MVCIALVVPANVLRRWHWTPTRSEASARSFLWTSGGGVVSAVCAGGAFSGVTQIMSVRVRDTRTREACYWGTCSRHGCDPLASSSVKILLKAEHHAITGRRWVWIRCSRWSG
jgi:hypothetical protein